MTSRPKEQIHADLRRLLGLAHRLLESPEAGNKYDTTFEYCEAISNLADDFDYVRECLDHLPPFAEGMEEEYTWKALLEYLCGLLEARRAEKLKELGWLTPDGDEEGAEDPQFEDPRYARLQRELGDPYRLLHCEKADCHPDIPTVYVKAVLELKARIQSIWDALQSMRSRSEATSEDWSASATWLRGLSDNTNKMLEELGCVSAEDGRKAITSSRTRQEYRDLEKLLAKSGSMLKGLEISPHRDTPYIEIDTVLELGPLLDDVKVCLEYLPPHEKDLKIWAKVCEQRDAVAFNRKVRLEEVAYLESQED